MKTERDELGGPGLDVLWLQAHADEASREVCEAGNAGEESHVPRELDRVWIPEDAVENSMHEDLEALSVSYGAFAVLLHP